MGITIRVPYGATFKEFRVKDFDELTLGDWKELTALDMPATKAAQYDLLCKYTGIPKNRLRMVRADDLDKMMTVMGEALALAQDVKNGELPDLPYEIDHEGVTYTVPQNLETDTIAGQWFDIEEVDKIEHEADIHIELLNVLLVPKGEEYEGIDRKAIWSRFGMRKAFELASHFFANSARYKRETSRCMNLFLTSALHRKEPGASASPSVTGQ